MQTQHNVFIRKFGDKAIIITVTDWDDFKELEKHSKHEDPDLIISGITSTGNIYTNMNMEMILSTKGEVKDITKDTKGSGLASIITGNSNAGAIWGYRKISGLSAITDMITPKLY
jgi:hypothetical protein